jgi:hypothetical protein
LIATTAGSSAVRSSAGCAGPGRLTAPAASPVIFRKSRRCTVVSPPKPHGGIGHFQMVILGAIHLVGVFWPPSKYAQSEGDRDETRKGT